MHKVLFMVKLMKDIWENYFGTNTYGKCGSYFRTNRTYASDYQTHTTSLWVIKYQLDINVRHIDLSAKPLAYNG